MQVCRNPHHPPHWFIDNSWYAITASIYQREPILAPTTHKLMLHERLKFSVTKLNLDLAAWVILDDHYHVLVKCAQSHMLPAFIRQLHGSSAYYLNQLDRKQGRRIWRNYWDRCIRDRHEFWRYFNYIHHNPVKHGYVPVMNAYRFSSYNEIVKQRGIEWMTDVVQRFSVRDYSDQYDA